jgi:hypothetical protein
MSLLAPLFLFGLISIGLPIWLHRLSSENPNKQSFSSIMFLEPGEPRRVLAKNLQYLLLLAMRIAFLVLLVLAFAGPAIWRTRAAAGTGSTLHLIVLDASASMGFGDRWSEAQDAARDVIGSLGTDDIAQVITVGRTATILTQQTADSAALRAAVELAEPTVFRLDLGQLMGSLDGVLRAAQQAVRIHVITDAQRSALPARFADLAPGRDAALQIHAVGRGDADNWAVESLTGSPLTGELAAGLRSFASGDAQKTLRLSLEDAVVDEQTVTVPAGGSIQVALAPLTLRAGSNRVSVALTDPDGLAGDDVRFLAVQRPEPRPVLIVSGDLRGRDTLFLTSALGTLEALVIEPRIIAPDDIADATLADYHFVVVTDAGLLGAAATTALQDYVQSGGAVLLALGPRAAALAAVPLTGEPLAPAGLADARAERAIGPIDASHPALRGLEALRAARFSRVVEVTPDAADRVLLELDSGAPLLLERELGSGRVLVYASTLDRQWSDLAVQPVFVPFLSGLANHLLGSAGFTAEATLGSTLSARTLGQGRGQIFDAAGNAALALGGTDDVLLDQIGYYEVVSGGVSQFIAVNFDTRESDLAAMDAAALERWQRLGGEAAAPRIAEAAAEPEREPLPLGPWILVILAALIAMESWAGNWHLRVQRGIAS